MSDLTVIGMISIVMAGLTTAIGTLAPAIGQGRAVSSALASLAQQPDAAPTITRTLFVGLAMVESTAIYCFVISMILLSANPYLELTSLAGVRRAVSRMLIDGSPSPPQTLNFVRA
ncbi:MAG: F0F1 ATP synthase subunit C [Gemmatimonadaceae bacterium]|nr:F0F1 ATP synthase subunit C [Gemmatimonadaceae bacterium]